MKKKIITTLIIIIAIISLNILIPKDVYAAKKEEEVFAEGITWELVEGEGGDMEYGVCVPSDAEKYEALPAIVWLHGSSTYGLSDAAGNGLPRAVLDDWEDSGYEGFRAYIVVPAMDNPDGSWPNYIGQLQSVLDDFTETYNVDTENIVLMGNSRGGTGALALAVQMPDYFSKCVACSAFYAGPFNTGMDTLCYYSWYADPASKYASYWKAAFGADRVFADGSGHGSVPYSAIFDDSGNNVR